MRRFLGLLLVVPLVVILFAYAKPSTASVSQSQTNHEAAPFTIQSLAPSADWTAESNQGGTWLGVSLSTAGDINGDGYLDA